MTERLLVLIALAVAALLLAGAFFGARSYLRLLAAVSAGRRLAMLPALIALAALAPLAASLGWAPGFGVSIALWLFSALAYCLAILTALVCWQGPMRWLGRAFAATFALPGLGLAFGFLRDPAGLLVLLLVLPGMRQHTSASGRISPTLTYETGTSHSLWGDTPTKPSRSIAMSAGYPRCASVSETAPRTASPVTSPSARDAMTTAC